MRPDTAASRRRSWISFGGSLVYIRSVLMLNPVDDVVEFGR
jgi:hypothetical protein